MELHAVISADFNGDGILDLEQSSTAALGVVIALGNGDGTFTTGTTVGSGASSLILGMTSGDIDGDGDIDIVAQRFNGNLEVMTNNGSGGFTITNSLTITNTSNRRPVLADMDGDGDLDILGSGAGTNGFSIYLNNGNGTFQAAVSYAGNGANRDVAIGDINGDGILDVVASSSSGLSTWLGNPNGTFQAVRTTPIGGIEGIELRDLNDDGILDIAALDSTTDRLFILTNNGTGTFSLHRSYAAGVDVYDLTVGDFNKDGILDIVTGDDTATTRRTQYFQGSGVSGVAPFDLTSVQSARDALDRLRNLINNVAQVQGSIEAQESRLGFARSNLLSLRENYPAADSRIRDADMGDEAATLVRTQILQQVASSILAQANQIPQIALRLLRD